MIKFNNELEFNSIYNYLINSYSNINFNNDDMYELFTENRLVKENYTFKIKRTTVVKFISEITMSQNINTYQNYTILENLKNRFPSTIAIKNQNLNFNLTSLIVTRDNDKLHDFGMMNENNKRFITGKDCTYYITETLSSVSKEISKEALKTRFTISLSEQLF